MGKQRRAREKFHIASARLASNSMPTTNSAYESQEFQGLPIKDWPVQKNIFEGLDINFDSLKKSLIEDDKISVGSVAKSLKYDKNGKLLTKAEKMKLKRALLLSKIDAIAQMKRESKQKRKNRKSPPILKLEELGKEDSVELQKVGEKKGIKKAKYRQKDYLDNMKSFQKILSNPAFRANPQKIISESIKKIVLS
uniref:Ribosome biogenesis protein SLX9 n=1 Tax=Clastoptera arizonana TaxID=38151 RepID=A0A1B6D0F3_9HEMI